MRTWTDGGRDGEIGGGGVEGRAATSGRGGDACREVLVVNVFDFDDDSDMYIHLDCLDICSSISVWRTIVSLDGEDSCDR